MKKQPKPDKLKSRILSEEEKMRYFTKKNDLVVTEDMLPYLYPIPDILRD